MIILLTHLYIFLFPLEDQHEKVGRLRMASADQKRFSLSSQSFHHYNTNEKLKVEIEEELFMYPGFPSVEITSFPLLDNIFHSDCVLVAVSYCLQGGIQLSLARCFFVLM